ncbi:hypothetical protein [Aurantiacibacter poecillastricola]|uniref:hypothetical protein n=1 Tax=Aurantiacibacter poecillastricola TaxID=3064385 RepID=UPI00273EE627|nr:hypothetical protein [Aurantiacibacter sp. 219JJ12-13]MDP5260528.1 hypothetical protein [Aurantiacibacter sp. 219JJ12-13]
MALIITFLLGVGNFACHRAVISSGHRWITDMPPATLKVTRLLSLGLEFVLLAGALHAAERGVWAWTWLYVGYSAVNIWAAWSIATRRI